jgi:hypothetical protein
MRALTIDRLFNSGCVFAAASIQPITLDEPDAASLPACIVVSSTSLNSERRRRRDCDRRKPDCDEPKLHCGEGKQETRGGTL